MMQFLGSINIGSSAYIQWAGRVRLSRVSTVSGSISTYNLRSASFSALAVCVFGLYRSIRTWWESKSIDIRQRNDSGMSLLYLAASYGSVTVCEKLAEMGADVNEEYAYEGTTALSKAARNGDEGVVNVLLRHGADVNPTCLHTPLRMASEYGKSQVLAILIQNGVDINHTTNDRPSALCLASQNGHQEVVELLLENKAIVNDLSEKGQKKHNALSAAAAHEHESIVNLLLQANANVDSVSTQHGTALEAAARVGNEKLLQILLDAEANIDARGRNGCTALYAAALNGHNTIASLLLDAGADTNVRGDDGETALHATVLHATALPTKAETNHSKIMQMLLSAGADVNAIGCGGKTALQLAAEFADPDGMVQTLLKAGANVNAEGGYYHTALQAAAANLGSTKTIQILLNAGANVNAKGGHWGTALIAASWYGPSTVVKTLLDAGADVNILTDNSGFRTALEAAQGNHPWDDEVVQQTLLDAGATPLADLFEEYRMNGDSGSQADASRRRDGWFREEKISDDFNKRDESKDKSDQEDSGDAWECSNWDIISELPWDLEADADADTDADADEIMRRARLFNFLEDETEFDSILAYMGLSERWERLKRDPKYQSKDERKDLLHKIFDTDRWNEALNHLRGRKGKETSRIVDQDDDERGSSMKSKSSGDDDDDNDTSDDEDADEFHDCREE